jgi:hypothetical protein
MTGMLTAVALGVAFLYVFYRAVEFQWPESYFGASDTASYSISLSPFRFAAFRFAPVAATCLFVAVTLDRANSHPLAGALLLGGAHGAATVGRAFVVGVFAPRTLRRHRAPVLLLRLVILIGVLAVALGCAALRVQAAPLVPEVHEMAATAWTAIFAGVLGAFVIRVSQGRTGDTTELMKRSRQTIPEGLWQLAESCATAAGGDVALVRAVMLVENLQRPQWFRRLERWKSVAMPHGTYGIMQVEATRRLSDVESVRLAVANRLAAVNVKTPEGYLDYTALLEFAVSYNPDPTFGRLLASAYDFVSSPD